MAGYLFVGIILRTFFKALSANSRHAALAGSLLTHIPLSRWSVAYNGMDFCLLDSKEPTEHGLRFNGKTVIGTSGHLRSLKRIDLLLKACTGLPRDSFHLLIVGDGPDRARLERIAHELDIENNTTFAGMQEDVVNYLAMMDIFVLPSGPQESFGNSLVEAMAVGLAAVIFRDGGGLVEHIQNGQTGYIVDHIDELSKRLRILLDDPILRRQVGQNASRHVRATYTLESMVRRYDEIYHQMLK
jgi:glycosyltransferase involved in cell wall biosynthesis